MEQHKKCSPRSPPAPASPRRHIHSSFPHYFYSTPAAPPSSDSISAFVALCEARLVADDDFAFGSSNRHHATLQNNVLPTAPKAAAAAATATTASAPAQPLRPPPRLQYIANIRKSLRNLRGASWGGTKAGSARIRKDDRADPFTAAADKVAREDAPWCQLPWRRKTEAAREAAKAGDEDIDGAATASKNRKGSSWISRLLRSALKGKERRRSDSKEDGKNGQLVGLVRSTTVSRYRNTQYGSSLLDCFGFK
ncbi:splicing factor PWI domain-containing protein isoform X2 [Iris pallida]|uniref:Splicing factor PWI domain-containing protein isoform X2 n=1 Tax=Iris pallida TaxID=29817 RepID=A0AAX6IIR2_IRIPA|nr:splicing factor PWI domain-containing protein isoform X2 [Iris pallida]KAJ6852714.1 splicing factor PWI domain-containing protein isoform X2 [Iris pallida]